MTRGAGQPLSGGQTTLFQCLLPAPFSHHPKWKHCPTAVGTKRYPQPGSGQPRTQPHTPEPTCPPHGAPRTCCPQTHCPLPRLRRLGWQLSVRCFSSLPWQSPTAPQRNWPREGSVIPAASVQLLSPPCTQEGSEATCVSQDIYRARWGHGRRRGIVPGTHTMSPPRSSPQGQGRMLQGLGAAPRTRDTGHGHPCAAQAVCNHCHAGGGLCLSFPTGNCCAAAEGGDSTHVPGLGVQPELGW